MVSSALETPPDLAPPVQLLPEREGTCFLLADVWTPGACRAWIAAAEARGFTPSASTYPPSYRDNDRQVHDDPALAAALFERVRNQLPPRLVRDGATWRLSGLNPRFRACRYRAGQRFGIHRDGAWSPGPGQRTFLTCMLYLTEAAAHEGGATVFHRERTGGGPPLLVVAPRQGALLVFGHDLWHEGQAVPAGTKYVLRSDVVYTREEEPLLAPALVDGQATRDEPTRLAGHTGYVWALQAPCAADPRLLSGSRDGTVRAWDLTSGGSEVRVRQPGSVTALARAPGGGLWTGSREGALRLWRAPAEPDRLLDDGAGAVLALCASPDGAWLAVGRAGGAVEWRRAADGALVRRTTAHTGWVWGLAWEEGGALVSAGEDGTLRRWAPDGAQELCLREPAPVRAVAVLPGGGLAWGRADGAVRARGAGQPARTVGRHAGAVRAVCALGPLADGLLASGGEDDRARVWSLAGEERSSLAHGDFVSALAALPDGRLASGCYDGLIRVSARGR